MFLRRVFTGALLTSALAGGVLVHGQQGTGQTPAPWPLSQTIRERGSSVTGAFEGWYYNKDGSQQWLIGYYNRNTKQEFDIPVGPNNKIEPGGPDQGQPTHFGVGRQYGVFTLKVPKDFGNKKLTWTLISNGQTNTITFQTKSDYIVEPLEDPANKNTPPTLKFTQDGLGFQGPPVGIATTLSGTVGVPVELNVWASDEGPKINIPEGRGRGRGRGGDAPAGPPPPPPLSVAWMLHRGPAAVKIEPVRPTLDRNNGGKGTAKATFSEPGDYILRAQGNDSTGDGGGGFQCCWTNAHVKVTVKPAATSGQ
jgi:hypothetical protein